MLLPIQFYRRYHSRRCLDRVLEAPMFLYCQMIKFPRTQIEVKPVRQKFYQKYGFPNVVGAIDCTHITLMKPKRNDWFLFLNRKNKYSINVQMVCDSDLQILGVARWPGSTHDAFIWQFSGVRELLNGDMSNCRNYLIGDSGYPLEPCLLTLYMDPSCPREQTFNEKHWSARNVIERCFKVLKSIFRILHESGGSLMYKPGNVYKIALFATMLHNSIKYIVQTDESNTPNDASNDEIDDQ